MNNKIRAFKPLITSILFLISMIVLVQMLSHTTGFVNYLYPIFYQAFYPHYSAIFGWCSISIGDLIYLSLMLYFLANVYVIIRCLVLNQQWRAFRFLAKIIWIFSFIYLLFHFLWGFNYYRTNLIETYKIESYSIEELKEIAQDLLEKSKDNRTQVNENDSGVFVYNKNDFSLQIPTQLDLKLQIPFHQIPIKAQKKFSIFSWFMRYFGVSGYYNPFTAEAQITRLSPDVSVPFTMAHEQAHQMGYAPEFEANYIGFLTCVQSNDPALLYSANYRALKYVLNAIYPEDSSFVQNKVLEFSPGMKRDYESEKQFHQRYEGRADRAFSTLNHLYLKSNQQNRGLESYNQFVDLIVYYYRTKRD